MAFTFSAGAGDVISLPKLLIKPAAACSPGTRRYFPAATGLLPVSERGAWTTINPTLSSFRHPKVKNNVEWRRKEDERRRILRDLSGVPRDLDHDADCRHGSEPAQSFGEDIEDRCAIGFRADPGASHLSTELLREAVKGYRRIPIICWTVSHGGAKQPVVGPPCRCSDHPTDAHRYSQPRHRTLPALSGAKSIGGDGSMALWASRGGGNNSVADDLSAGYRQFDL